VNASRPHTPRVPSLRPPARPPAPALVGRDGRVLKKRNEMLPANDRWADVSGAFHVGAPAAKSVRERTCARELAGSFSLRSLRPRPSLPTRAGAGRARVAAVEGTRGRSGRGAFTGPFADSALRTASPTS